MTLAVVDRNFSFDLPTQLGSRILRTTNDVTRSLVELRALFLPLCQICEYVFAFYEFERASNTFIRQRVFRELFSRADFA